MPKTTKKKHHVMRFNATLNVDFAQWRAVKMERDCALQNSRQIEEEIPKFGAGSEYNRELKEELRRKRFGINPKKYRPEAQPWILKTGKNGKKFRGIREGGVGENAAFYVFTHAPDKAIEAYPLHEWYNFQPIQRYKSLSAEEAEAEFGRRKKVINYFSLMLRKRLKGEEADDGVEDVGDEKKSSKGKAKELKISDMDEWIDSDDDDSSVSSKDQDKEKDSENEEEKQKNKKGKKKEEAAKTKKKKRDVDGEAFEESDDGDEEGRELDYISDSSEDVSDLEVKVDKEMKGVAEEDALRKLLTSDEDSDEEREKSNEEEEKEEEAAAKEKEHRDKKKKKPKKVSKESKKDSSSDFSTDSDSDVEQQEKKKSSSKKKDNAATSASRSASPGPEVACTSSSSTMKRKAQGNSLPSDLTTPDSSNSPVNTPAKKPKVDTLTLPSSFSGVVSSNSNKEDYGITEEAVRRYLLRKPMTTTELLTKFKNKKTGVSSEKLVDTMTQILKRINPVRQTIMGKMYLSIKVDK